MKFEELLCDFEYYKKRFNEWDASEKVFDQDTAAWELVCPSDSTQKVSLYRDKKDIFIYGMYGQSSFNNENEISSAHSLNYEDSYLMLKFLDPAIRESWWDYEVWKRDFTTWLTDYIENAKHDSAKVIEFIEGKLSCMNPEFYISDYCERNHCLELMSVISFAWSALRNEHATDDEWITFLVDSDVYSIEEDVENSRLWSAGVDINEDYFICMLALSICSEKIKQANELSLERICREEGDSIEL